MATRIAIAAQNRVERNGGIVGLVVGWVGGWVGEMIRLGDIQKHKNKLFLNNLKKIKMLINN